MIVNTIDHIIKEIPLKIKPELFLNFKKTEMNDRVFIELHTNNTPLNIAVSSIEKHEPPENLNEIGIMK